MKKKLTYRRAFHLSLALAALALPFGNFLAPFFLPLLIFWIVVLAKKGGARPDKKKLLLFSLPVLFYLSYFISWLVGNKEPDAAFQLEVKLSFLCIPIVVLFYHFPPALLRVILKFFIFGLLFSAIICTVHALYLFRDGKAEHLFSSDLSFLELHPSYFSAYIVFALYFLIAESQNGKPLFKKRWFALFVVLFLSVFNFMLASKMGWFAFILVMFFLFCRQMVRLKKVKLLVAGFLLLCVAAFSLYRLVPVVNEKVGNLFAATDEKNIDLSTTESSAVRVLVWKSAKKVISENFWSGVGSGKVKSELAKVYAERGYTGALEKKLNCHNQFLEVFVALGFFGFLLFCAMLLVPWFVYNGKFPAHGFWFLLIMIINFSVESMLQLQAGTVFFAFFYSVILISGKR